ASADRQRARGHGALSIRTLMSGAARVRVRSIAHLTPTAKRLAVYPQCKRPLVCRCYEADEGPVCTENLIRIDCVTESPNVNGDDRSLLPLPDPVRLAVQVEEPRSMTISAGSIHYRRARLPCCYLMSKAANASFLVSPIQISCSARLPFGCWLFGSLFSTLARARHKYRRSSVARCGGKFVLRRKPLLGLGNQ